MPAVPQNILATQASSTLNTGRQRNFITGIQGVSAGGQASINFACDRRYHRLLFNCTAVNYTGVTGGAITKVTGAGTGGTATIAVNSFGVPSTFTIVTGGSGYAVGDIISVADATGAGQTYTVLTVSTGAILTASVNANTATPTAINPATLLNTIKLIVNGVNVADLTAGQEILRAKFNGVSIGLGQLPIFFTEPWRQLTRFPEITAWDMAGQSSFQVQIGVNSGYISPGVTGDMEFDYIRNTSSGGIVSTLYQQLLAAGGAPSPILAPISRHAFTFQVNAGLNLFGQGQIPFNFPILRMYFIGSTPGNLTQLEVLQDSNKVEEGFIISQNNGGQLGQINEFLTEYGFVPTVFDTAYVADMNNRIDTALKCKSNLQIKIYSAIAQSLTVIQEKLPGSYSS